MSAALVACDDDDFKDWANPQVTEPEESTIFGDGLATAVPTIDIAKAAGADVKICDITAPISTNAAYQPSYKVTISGNEYDINGDGMFPSTTLQELVVAQYGKRPVERELDATLSAWLNDGVASVKLASRDFKIVAIPEAPIIEEAYYLTGNFNGWDNTNMDYKLANGGGDVYDDPVFTCTIPADGITGDLEFKVTPASGIGGDWSGCLCAGEDGKFVDQNAGGNFVVAYDPNALFYRFSFDMMNMTWEAAGLAFSEYIYEIGGESGWATAHALRSPNSDGIYKGYYWLDSEFKFKPNENDWDGDWECVGDGQIGEGSNNCPAPEAGFYEIVVDLAAMTYQLTAVNVGLIGSATAGGWDTDTDMTYNTTTGAWELKDVELAKGDIKFRANDDWAINWGGDLNGLTQDGANISVIAGKYDISLKLSVEGQHTAVVTETSGAVATWSDFVYYAGDYNGWSADASPLAHQGAGAYEGYYFIKAVDNESTWGFKIVDGGWYGEGGNGTLSADGGNIDPGQEGFYQINADMANMTYAITPMTIGLIGDATAGGWDADTEMSFDQTAGCWIYTGALGDGTFKFRANGGWDINWGGDLTNLAKNGENITVSAGEYSIKFYPNCDGKAYAEIQ